MHGTVEIGSSVGSAAGIVGSAAAFYATPRGETAAAVLNDRLGAFWPDLRGMSVLGLGFAEPYLPLWQDTAYRCVAAVPSSLAPATGTHGCVVEEDRLPFPDLSFDRIVLVHAVDAAGDARRLLREVWRVLKDDGRILVVAPNRNGMWAHLESVQPQAIGGVAGGRHVPRGAAGRGVVRAANQLAFSAAHVAALGTDRPCAGTGFVWCHAYGSR